MLFDTHCHLNFNMYSHDVHEVIERTIKDDIWMVIVGTNQTTSLRADQIVQQYRKGVYASVGLHPVHITRQKIKEGGIEFVTSGEEFDYDTYRKMIMDSLRANPVSRSFVKTKQCRGRVVAVGETGLDYFYTTDSAIIKKQEKVFKEHMHLADEFHLPIIIHARGTESEPHKVYDDLIHIIEHERIGLKGRLRGIVHSFYGTYEQAQQLIEMGLFIGINASIKDDAALAEVVKRIDLKYLVLETDAPYFHPSLNAGKRNEPKNVQMVSQFIAKLKNYSIYEVNEVTTQNALHLYNIVC